MGEGVDKVAVGSFGESVISVSLITGVVGGCECESSVTDSMDIGGDMGAELSVLSESLTSCPESRLIPDVGTGSFSLTGSSLDDGSGIVI